MSRPTNKQKILAAKAAKKATNKKYFVKPNANTKRLPANNLLSFVLQLMNISTPEASADIANNEVTVNGNVVNDPTLMLVSGDVVRAEDGHMLQNIGYMAVVE